MAVYCAYTKGVNGRQITLNMTPLENTTAVGIAEIWIKPLEDLKAMFRPFLFGRTAK